MPRKKDSIPTVEEILELYDDVKKRYDASGLWGCFDEDETFYELQFKDRLLLPTEFQNEAVILPTGRDIVDTCVDHTDISNVRVWVNRKGTSPKSEEEQELLRKFGLGVIYRNNVEASLSPFRVGAKHYWMHGLTVFKTFWDADRYPDKPIQKQGESEEAYAVRIDNWRSKKNSSIPIVITAVHPRNVLFDPYHEDETFVFEVREELCLNVKSRFSKWSNPKNRKITDKVEHITFFHEDYRCELYDREPVMRYGNGVVRHSYGLIPYVKIDTGLGNISPDNDPKKRYVGVLRYVRDVLLSESRDYSIGDIILKKNAWPWGYLKGPNAESVTDIRAKFGEFNPLPDGVDIVEMQPKLPPDALLTWLQVSSNYLAAHAAPPSVRGMGETGVRAAADRRLLIAEASARYLYANKAFQNRIAKVLSNCASIMKNVVPGNINVWAKTPTDEFDIEINKDKMKEPFTFYVEFSAISEEDEYRRHDDLERLVSSTIVGKQWARQQMSNVDPEAMELEEEVERMKLDPMVQQIFSQYLAGKVQEALVKRSRAEGIDNPPPPLQQGGEGGQVAGGEAGRRMAPPSSPVPGQAQEIENKLRQMRSQTSMNPTQGIGGGGNRP